jgi:PAS domain S-box-containing protein
MRMPDFKRLQKINPWHFLWIAVLISEIFTALMNTLNSYIWYGKVSRDLLLIGSIDALMVSFLVSLIILYFLKQANRLEQAGQLLQREIDNRIILEEALKESEVRYRKLFESAGDAIFILEAEGPEAGRIVDANQSAATMHGYTLEELLKLHIKDLDGPSAAAEAPARISRMLGGEWIKAEIIHRKKDGAQFPVEISAGLLEIGRHKFFLAFDRDIGQRKETEAALLESEEKYRSIVDNAHEGIWLIDIHGKTAFVNPQMAAMLGYRPEEMKGRGVEEFLSNESIPEFRQKIAARKKGLTSQYDLKFHRKDGAPLWAIVNAAPLLDSGGQVTGAFGMVTDISERKRIEEALRESEALYRQVIEAAPYSITVSRISDGRFIQVNASFTKICGYTPEEALGRTPFDLGLFVEPRDREQFLQVLKEKGEIDKYELQYRAKGGRVIPVLLSARPLRIGGEDCLLAVALDISDKLRAQREREDLEKQLRQAQKMEAIGTLAGGIAHDFNNILMALLGYTEMALMDIPPGTAIYNDLKKVSQAGHRAKDLVGQILAFTRKSELELKPVEICALLKEALKLIRAVLPSSVEIRLDLSEEAALVVANATQIHQVIINLCTNGVQAMREKSGILRVTLSKVQFFEQVSVVYSTLYPGYYIHLSVEDTGEGIKSEILDRIFDPYFTTKEIGEGTGMGLATVLGIIKGHGGAITVETTPGRGSRFNVFLPLSEQGDGLPKEKTRGSFPQGRGRILLVDDEETLVGLEKKMLEQLGYSVAVQNNGLEALDTFKKDPQGLLGIESLF